MHFPYTRMTVRGVCLQMDLCAVSARSTSCQTGADVFRQSYLAQAGAWSYLKMCFILAVLLDDL